MFNKKEKVKESLCSKTWFIIVMLFVFFPVSIYGMWRYKKFNIVVRILLSVSFSIICLTEFMQIYNDRDNIKAEIESERQASIETSVNASIKAESERIVQESIENERLKQREFREKIYDGTIKNEIIDRIDVKAVVGGYGSINDYYTVYHRYYFDFGNNIKFIIDGNETPKTGRRHVTGFSFTKFTGNYDEGWEDEYDYYRVNENGIIIKTWKKGGNPVECNSYNIENSNKWLKEYLNKELSYEKLEELYLLIHDK